MSSPSRPSFSLLATYFATLLQYQDELESLVNNELAAFNKTLEVHELPRVVTGQKPETD